MTDSQTADEMVALTADVVSAYVANNPVPASELPGLIGSVHQAMAGLATGEPDIEEKQRPPAVPVRKSVSHDHVVCLEDGKKFKSLKRHLATSHGMTPEEYRSKWGLPRDYPMVAPDYAAARSDLAKSMGLGLRKAKQKRAKRAKAA